jgi:nucleoside-diphosphate-sugar epimerase
VLPLRPDWRVDIVSADYVGRAIVHVHQDPQPRYETYHLSSGTASLSYGEIVERLRHAGAKVPRGFLPGLTSTVSTLVDVMSQAPRGWPTTYPASLFKVFLPYLTFDTVFDNTRIVEALGEAPVPFTEYAPGLLRFAIEGRFTYPYLPYPHSPQPHAQPSGPELAA